MGKSRLVWEITHSPILVGWRVLKASAVSYGKATSYLPVIDLLKEYFGPVANARSPAAPPEYA